MTAFENPSGYRSGQLTVKTKSGITKTVYVSQTFLPGNLHFSASFQLNDFSVDGSGYLDSVSVIIDDLTGDVYNSFTCNNGNTGRRSGSADFSEDGGIEIGQIRIRVSGNVGGEVGLELKLNEEVIESDTGMFPIAVNKTLYGSNTMSLYCEFDWY